MLLLLSISSASAQSEVSEPKQYDGIWFLGFNMNSKIFGNTNGFKVRRAFGLALDREWIIKNIVGDTVVPASVIPPGMSGHDPGLKAPKQNISKAKALMKEAGYAMNDPRIKKLTLFHTNGEMTVEIAKWIKRYLVNIGVDLKLVEVDYADQKTWEIGLKGGTYDMFLMGYKSSLFDQIFIGDKKTKQFHAIDCKKVPSAEAIEFFGSFKEATSVGFSPCGICRPMREEENGSLSLIQPLFYSKGHANFTFYNNPRIDSLLEQADKIDPALKTERDEKLEEVANILFEESPVIPIFYITKL